jgi:hypothetical protein
MLIRAAAASAEIWALWRDAIRRTLLNFDQLCFGELLLFPDDFGRNQLMFNRVRNKDSLALVPRYAFPTKSNVFDFQIDNAHIINTLLQLGVSDNDTGIKLL